MGNEPKTSAAKGRSRLYIGAALLLLLSVGTWVMVRWVKPPVLDLRGNARSCETHGLPLQEDTVHIVYGEPALGGQNYSQALSKLFPNANTFHAGGCVPLRPRKATVRFCPDCRKAFREWCLSSPDPGARSYAQ